MRIYYESEGPRYGLKTLFLEQHELANLEKIRENLMKSVRHVHILAEHCSTADFRKIRFSLSEFPTTVEVDIDRCNAPAADYAEHLFFLNAARDPNSEERYRVLKNVFVKVWNDMDRANRWAAAGFQVLLGSLNYIDPDHVSPLVRVNYE